MISNAMSGMSGGETFIVFILTIFVIVSLWKVFQKAGKPGWACLIPIYNIYVMLKIVGKPGWWVLLFLIPIVNVIVGIIASIELSKRFGKGVGFGLGLALLGFIFYPVLAFSDAQYQAA